MKTVTKTMLIDEILELDDGLTDVFAANGLNCLGCPGAARESLEEAAEGHGVELDSLISDLNRYLEEKQAIQQ